MCTFKADSQIPLSLKTPALILDIRRMKRKIYYPKLSLKSLSWSTDHAPWRGAGAWILPQGFVLPEKQLMLLPACVLFSNHSRHHSIKVCFSRHTHTHTHTFTRCLASRGKAYISTIADVNVTSCSNLRYEMFYFY